MEASINHTTIRYFSSFIISTEKKTKLTKIFEMGVITSLIFSSIVVAFETLVRRRVIEQ